MPAGRPLKFKTVEELDEKAGNYFDSTPITQWTITGLALALDTSRETLMNYEHKVEFFDTIKKYKTKVEYAYELSLRVNGRTGDIFALKNFGWKDKTEIDQNITAEVTSKEYDQEAAKKFSEYLKDDTKA